MLEDTGLKTMPTTSYATQYQRQRISDTWEPRGFERYQYQRALLHQMPVLGGPHDQMGGNPDRLRAATSCQESLDCHCG